MTTPEALGHFNRGIAAARQAYAADKARAEGRCVCGRRLEANARTCRPCRRAKKASK